MIGVVGCVVPGSPPWESRRCGSRTGGECQTVGGVSPVDETMVVVAGRCSRVARGP